MTPEGKVKELVKIACADHGAYRFMPVQNGMGMPSVDFLICHKGRFIGVETKAPGKKPTQRQELTMQDMRDAGAMTFVIDGEESLKQLVEYFQEG